MRALVLDDSRAMRTILKGILVEAGFEIHEAASVPDALSIVTADPDFDLALVDWNLPQLQGIEFVRGARSQRRLNGMRIVMVTTETELSNVESAMRAGANEYIMKPFTRASVLEKLAMIGFSVAQDANA